MNRKQANNQRQFIAINGLIFIFTNFYSIYTLDIMFAVQPFFPFIFIYVDYCLEYSVCVFWGSKLWYAESKSAHTFWLLI